MRVTPDLVGQRLARSNTIALTLATSEVRRTESGIPRKNLSFGETIRIDGVRLGELGCIPGHRNQRNSFGIGNTSANRVDALQSFLQFNRLSFALHF
jgi:hypothetical protein